MQSATKPSTPPCDFVAFDEGRSASFRSVAPVDLSRRHPSAQLADDSFCSPRLDPVDPAVHVWLDRAMLAVALIGFTVIPARVGWHYAAPLVSAWLG